MLIAPNRKPQQFGFKAGDAHLVVNAASKTCKAFDYGGRLLFQVPTLADGQHPNWRAARGDTPPGLYRIGTIYDDHDSPPGDLRTAMSYGWVTFDLVDLEGNEDGVGRSGICIHGGGSGLGWPGAWAPQQQLLPTWGCIRMRNQDLLRVLELTKKGQVFVSVYQDDQ